MERITIIDFEWTDWNGFHFEFIGVEYWHLDSALLGMYINDHGLQIDILYFKIEIKLPWQD